MKFETGSNYIHAYFLQIWGTKLLVEIKILKVNNWKSITSNKMVKVVLVMQAKLFLIKFVRLKNFGLVHSHSRSNVIWSMYCRSNQFWSNRQDIGKLETIFDCSSSKHLHFFFYNLTKVLLTFAHRFALKFVYLCWQFPVGEKSSTSFLAFPPTTNAT